MKHPYADILHAIAEGKEIQARQQMKWVDSHAEAVFCSIVCDKSHNPLQPEDYRIKPATIAINGVECEACTKHGPYFVEINGHGRRAFGFASKEARDAAYAALIKPFGEQA